MRKLFTFLTLILLLAPSLLHAQAFYAEGDTVVNDSVIISEVLLPSSNRWGYYELTNMSSRTVNLEHYYFKNSEHKKIFGYDTWRKPTMRGTLDPGKSFTWVIPYQDWSNDVEGNPTFPDRMNANFFAMEMADTVAINNFCAGSNAVALFQRFYNDSLEAVDSAMIDVFALNEDFSKDFGIIAGKNSSHPAGDFLWSRKTSLKKGSVDWLSAKGTDLIDSDWIPVPFTLLRPTRNLPYASFGRHGEGTPEGIISKGKLSIDHTNKTINMPYGIRRDSLFREFTYTTNVTWSLNIGTDTSHFYVQTDDTITFHFLGEDLNSVKYAAKVGERDQDFNALRPIIYKNDNGYWVKRYNLSYGKLPMDTIGDIPFATPIDTFLKYMIVEEGCTADLIFSSGVTTPEISDSDTILVTSDNGKQKKYVLKVDKYNPNRISSLKQVIFPGSQLWENPYTYELTDTFLEFGSQTLEYFIKLPIGSTEIPAILAQSSNSNAHVIVRSGKNLFGSEEDRTTRVTVIAEQDTLVSEYTFTFIPEREEPELDYSLFISESGSRWGGDKPGSGSVQYQIFNPSNDEIDLTDYMFYQQGGNWESLMAFLANPVHVNKRAFPFGYKVVVDPISNLPVFQIDNHQTVLSLGAKEVFSLVGENGFPYAGGGTDAQKELVDYRIFRSNITAALGADPYGNDKSLFYGYPVWHNNQKNGAHIMLLKMKPEKRDSLRDGLKHMYDLVNDWDVVDMVNGPSYAGSAWEMYDVKDDTLDVVIKNTKDRDFSAHRRPFVYKGNPVERHSFGAADVDGKTLRLTEWDFAGNLRGAGRALYENHIMNVTEHLAYLTSNSLNVTEGISSPQNIYGVIAGTSVAELFAQVYKVDSMNKIMVIDAGGLEKTGTETILAGDILKSYSARGLDSIMYNLNIGSLSDDIILTSKTNDYTVSIANDNLTGEVSGVEYGMNLSDLLEQLSVSDFARMLPIDSGEMVLPLTIASGDTTANRNGTMIDALVSEKTYITVIAQNGDMCKYDLTFAKPAMPYLLSEVYTVTEDSKSIDFVSSITVRNMLNNLIAAPGYELKIINKLGQERTVGQVKYDDLVVVFDPENPEIQVAYFLNFFNEMTRDALSIKKATRNLNLKAYPNPSNGLFSINTQASDKIMIHDITGKLIRSFSASGDISVVDLSQNPHGIYLLTIIRNGLNETITLSKI